ncbi:MAG TPA: hypothetical protein VJZ69_01565 [Clostridia bacterium]|nr:hypothetical protein [Clostridia bacterium]
MKMKPVILILTSSDVSEYIPKVLKEGIEASGDYYAVVFDESHYESKLKYSSADKLQWLKMKYTKKSENGESKNESAESKEKRGKFNRIRNAVLRFKPDCIVCLSPYSHCLALDSKRKTEFETPIIALMTTFTADKSFFDLTTDAFIVENEDAKAEVVRLGIPARSVVALGLPLTVKAITHDEKSELRKQLGIPKSKTVFLNCRDKKDCTEMFDMLLDQGDIINVIAYCPKSDTFSELRKLVELKSSDNVQLFDKKANFDEYLAASDIVITYYNVSTIYKSFLLGRAVVTFPPKGDMAEKDLQYLAHRNLIYAAKDSKDIIFGLYKLLQTNLADELLRNTSDRKIENNVKSIAEFVTGFGKQDKTINSEMA